MKALLDAKLPVENITVISNNTKAVNLYRKLGFLETRRLLFFEQTNEVKPEKFKVLDKISRYQKSSWSAKILYGKETLKLQTPPLLCAFDLSSYKYEDKKECKKNYSISFINFNFRFSTWPSTHLKCVLWCNFSNFENSDF